MAVTWKQLDELLFYNSETGKLYYKVSKGGRVKAGEEVGSIGGTGYLNVKIRGVKYRVHRVIWALVYKEKPPAIIDHEDGNKQNNKLTNLRVATKSQNSHSSKLRHNNSTGFAGLTYHKRSKSWFTKIVKDGILYGKYFKSKDKAISHLVCRRRELYGEFVRM